MPKGRIHMSRRLALAFATLVATLAPASAAALPAQPDPGQWTLNRSATVQAVLATPGLTYLGGAFTYAGPRTGSGLVTDPSSGDARPGMPVYDATVSDAVPDGAGGAYVAGSFTDLAGSGRSYLARLRPDGSVDPAFAPAPDGPVQALVMRAGILYAAGSFDQLGGAPRDRLGAVTATGAATAWNPAPDASVQDLAASASSIYAGGYFSAIGGGTSDKVARLDPVTGALVPGFAPPPTIDDDVNGVAVSPDGADLYVWGTFESPTDSVAQLSPTTGAASAWDPQPTGGRVAALAVSADSQTVYLGGRFTSLRGQARASLGAVARTAGATLQAWSPGAAGALFPGSEEPYVGELARIGAEIYVGGSFLQIGGVERHGAARVSTGGAVAGWNPDVSDPAEAFVALGSGDVLTGGGFVAARGVVRRNLVALDARGVATGWNPDVRHSPPFGASVRALALSADGETVYAGGDFATVGGATRRSLAGISVATGAPTAFDGQIAYPSPSFTRVHSLAAHPDGRLFAAGWFGTVRGVVRKGVAALDGQTGEPTAWNAGSSTDQINAIALSPDGARLYAAGSFTYIGGAGHERLAALDTTTAALFTEWTPKPNVAPDRFALSPDGSTLYVAAQYLTKVGSQTPQLTRPQLAAVSTAGTGEALAAFDAQLAPGAQVVQAIAPSTDGQRLYVGGSFDAVGGQPRAGFAELSATTGVAAPFQLELGGFGQPLALAHSEVPSGAQLVVGGSLSAGRPAPASGALQLRDRDPVVPGSPAPPAARPDTERPRISASLSRRRFVVARRASQRKRGTTIRFTLSEAAGVELTVLRKIAGRRSGGRCLRRARGGRRCTITRTVGRLPARAGRDGRNSLRFTGKLRGRALTPGAYALRLRATDAAGNRSKPVAVKFRVIAAP
jgi:hypothetical protein